MFLGSACLPFVVCVLILDCCSLVCAQWRALFCSIIVAALVAFLSLFPFTTFLLLYLRIGKSIRLRVVNSHGSALTASCQIKPFYTVSVLTWEIVRVRLLNGFSHFSRLSLCPVVFLAHLCVHYLHLNLFLLSNQFFILPNFFVKHSCFLFQTWLQESSPHELYDIFILANVQRSKFYPLS